MNLPSNNPRAGVTLLESLMMLAVLALIMGLAASGFQGRQRPEDPANVRAQIAQIITLARNEAMLTQKTIRLSLSILNAPFKQGILRPCNPEDPAEISVFPDGTVLSPIFCTASLRLQIDWLTGIPTAKREVTNE